MKLKEWGLMRHKSRRSRLEHSHTDVSVDADDDTSRATSVTARPMSVDSETLEHQTTPGSWQVASSGELMDAQPTFMGMLSQPPKWVSFTHLHTSGPDFSQLATFRRNSSMDARPACRIRYCARHARAHSEQRMRETGRALDGACERNKRSYWATIPSI